MKLKTVNITAWIDHTAYGKITVPADATDEQIWQLLNDGNICVCSSYMTYDDSFGATDWRWAEWTTDAPFDENAPQFIEEFKDIDP